MCENILRITFWEVQIFCTCQIYHFSFNYYNDSVIAPGDFSLICFFFFNGKYNLTILILTTMLTARYPGWLNSIIFLLSEKKIITSFHLIFFIFFLSQVKLPQLRTNRSSKTLFSILSSMCLVLNMLQDCRFLQ